MEKIYQTFFIRIVKVFPRLSCSLVSTGSFFCIWMMSFLFPMNGNGLDPLKISWGFIVAFLALISKFWSNDLEKSGFVVCKKAHVWQLSEQAFSSTKEFSIRTCCRNFLGVSLYTVGSLSSVSDVSKIKEHTGQFFSWQLIK